MATRSIRGFFQPVTSRTGAASQDRLPLQQVDPERLKDAMKRRSAYLKVRRGVDLLAVTLLAPACLILVAFAAIAILATMGRPIILLQDRIGAKGRIFRAIKLRTMTLGGGGDAVATAPDDVRVTPLGSFLRRAHIDELPQLWNIAAGEMALIGPRPEWRPLALRYAQAFPEYDLRHFGRPGLTGWAQVRQGYVSTLDEARIKVEYDLYYLCNASPMLDVKIMLMTMRVVLDRRFAR